MTENSSSLLSWIIFTPLLFGILLLCLPKKFEQYFRHLALVAGMANLLFAIKLWSNFDGAISTMQFVQSIPWIPKLGISYLLGVDGISLPLVMLTAIITPIAILGTWPHDLSKLKQEKFFVLMVLALQTGMYGTFLASDIFLFYFFWEIVLIPMFFLIGIWGGAERIYATIKFFLYTMVGSLLMLVAIWWMIYRYKQGFGVPSASFADLARVQYNFVDESWMKAIFSEQGLLFLAFTLAFVIKVPMVPFHTWLPDAHVQAPTLGSVFLAAVLLKLGTYGLMRISMPMFPEAAYYFSMMMMGFGVIGVVYGAFCAWGQSDFKKLVAYSSVSHMGYILVGLFSFNQVAIAGSLYQMINHGISSAGLFMVVGFLYERLHTRNLDDFGNIAKVAPLMAIGFMILTLSSVALPGTNGFVGEFTILFGTFQAQPAVALIAGLGVIFGAIYALKAYQRVMFGPLTNDHNKNVVDLSVREFLAMGVLAIFIFGIGFFPGSFFGKSDTTLSVYSQQLIEKVIHE
ncbi:MAG: hypothetical protein A2504_11180 [Bdellovibrionales bacterium RIFOXYD12_FULL_39_22]|nr:MAG: hypothetical protein A2385_09745 [Bdellovibrionales bacterium RIFOXYB1_FULL_39_21]OFZ44237.1 MAG: hypothetical protein A2485_07365 [Bdellovibrionales bacterium RIFOXYC12_FULL_39_17]OFZ46779.1 MAG: hypothetical protein A2404_04600 [Bdellovibrionales bacterium RIFOXYC1_FULL_39_130]OFZ75944.1 MAG: hypothetical protein A2560_02550 [Bdellovibrionales bacterium RIFOXYD1_FULL_39_84]OFZ95458.1 MAG: hypothetical protein A2504_11180 [Bdellovibrionales bacterium RIFOXYD12_FULL_39_22]HLE09807.1 NA